MKGLGPCIIENARSCEKGEEASKYANSEQNTIHEI